MNKCIYQARQKTTLFGKIAAGALFIYQDNFGGSSCAARTTVTVIIFP